MKGADNLTLMRHTEQTRTGDQMKKFWRKLWHVHRMDFGTFENRPEERPKLVRVFRCETDWCSRKEIKRMGDY